jgi:hypothetical protein
MDVFVGGGNIAACGRRWRAEHVGGGTWVAAW